MRAISNKKLRLKRTLALLLAAVTALSALTVFIDIRLRTVAADFARYSLSSALSTAINKAAERLIAENGLTYDKVSDIKRDSDNRVTSVEIDTNSINFFKSRLATEVQKELNKNGDVTVKVPLSAAFGIYYTYLSYPKISYTLSAVRIVSTNYKNEFLEAGINQVLHRISVSVSALGNLAIIGRDAEVSEITTFTLAETVIVGAVPDAYTKIDYATEDIVDDVFDYGALSKE